MCAVCHGRTGDGYAADQAPALAHADFLASVSDEYLRTAIAHGRRGTTMSAWSLERGGPLAQSDLDALVALLRYWAVLPRAALDDRPGAGNVSRGEVLFDRECKRCHGARGAGGPHVHIGDADLLATAGNGFLRYAIERGRSGTPMPPFGEALGRAGVDDVLALLRSWQVQPIAAAPVTAPMLPPKPPPIPLGPVPLNPHGPEPQGFRPSSAGGMQTTSVDVVKAQLDRGARMALLDARAPSDYVGKHIAGAVSVPFYDPDGYMSGLPRNAWLVCYCACPHAESGQLAQRLIAKGFTKVTVLDEGFLVWDMRGYPTHTGVEP
jgi:cytochrome c oxidase cbb3-type subunit 3/ubiquinol-cytochrome c reductase cytochrome c subunit